MTYIENIFVCMAAPLIMAMMCCGKKHRPLLIYCLIGMLMCLLSAYVNTFFAQQYNADITSAATQIAPVVEEIMKFLPMLFYILVFEPDKNRFHLMALIVATSFATFENICYLTQNGAESFMLLPIRGFGTGAMHVVCGGAYGSYLKFVWDNIKLRMICFFGILCLVITYHAIYNLLVSVGGVIQVVAYFIPMVTVAIGWICYASISYFKKNVDKN